MRRWRDVLDPQKMLEFLREYQAALFAWCVSARLQLAW